MTLIEKLKLIERVDQLIRMKSTGNPKELALKLELSESGVYRLIDLMKTLEAPIYYSSCRKSYCYNYEVTFSIGFVKKEFFLGGVRNISSLPKIESVPLYISINNNYSDILQTL